MRHIKIIKKGTVIEPEIVTHKKLSESEIREQWLSEHQSVKTQQQIEDQRIFYGEPIYETNQR